MTPDDSHARGGGRSFAPADAREPEGGPRTRGARRQIEVQVRFSDTDALGHVNNAVYASYAELGRIDLLRRVSWDDGGPILARIAIDFKAQVRLGSQVVVTSEIARIGRSSMELRQEILADGALAAVVDSVVVWFDYQAQRPVRVPEAVRATLLGDEAGPGPGGERPAER